MSVRLRTFLGAVAVYATLPLAAVVWTGRAAYRIFRRRPLLLLLLPCVPVSFAVHGFFFSTGSAPEPVTLQVEPGTSFSAFTRELEAHGITERGRLLRWAARLTGADSRLHVGLYEVSPEDSPYRILVKLWRHEQVYLQFTLVEGCTLKECLPGVANTLDLPVDSLWTYARPPRWTRKQPGTREPAEGYLFPDTYKIPWGAGAAEVIAVMAGEMDEVWNEESAGYSGSLSRHEAITLASLIEAEAKEGEERRKISSVFHNRLRRGMRLQCDPTVIYAMGGLDRPLLRKDWEFESPYNTYRVSGLPPGPIGAPGRASLRAALYPETTEYLYFMARGDGTHAFSETLREHEAAYRETKRKAARKP